MIVVDFINVQSSVFWAPQKGKAGEKGKEGAETEGEGREREGETEREGEAGEREEGQRGGVGLLEP